MLLTKIIIAASLVIAFLLLSGCTASNAGISGAAPSPPPASNQVLKLPPPALTGKVSLEESLAQRRSIRNYSSDPLSLEAVSKLLWAAQGITSDSGGRTAPSAGALYPLEIYLVAGNVQGLSPGVYHYLPAGHELVPVRGEDIREALSQASLGQAPVKNGAIDIVISAVYDRTSAKYGERGIRFAHMEAGHCAQNILLQAAALGLGAVPVGAFDDDRVKQVLGLAADESPLYIIPAGNQK